MSLGNDDFFLLNRFHKNIKIITTLKTAKVITIYSIVPSSKKFFYFWSEFIVFSVFVVLVWFRVIVLSIFLKAVEFVPTVTLLEMADAAEASSL